jgi:Ni/Co efflux regulator RcnB
VVTDYRTRHLREPPRGYHWIRDEDNNFLLVAITTGVILDLALH